MIPNKDTFLAVTTCFDKDSYTMSDQSQNCKIIINREIEHCSYITKADLTFKSSVPQIQDIKRLTSNKQNLKIFVSSIPESLSRFWISPESLCFPTSIPEKNKVFLDGISGNDLICIFDFPNNTLITNISIPQSFIQKNILQKQGIGKTISTWQRKEVKFSLTSIKSLLSTTLLSIATNYSFFSTERIQHLPIQFTQELSILKDTYANLMKLNVKILGESGNIYDLLSLIRLPNKELLLKIIKDMDDGIKDHDFDSKYDLTNEQKTALVALNSLYNNTLITTDTKRNMFRIIVEFITTGKKPSSQLPPTYSSPTYSSSLL